MKNYFIEPKRMHNGIPLTFEVEFQHFRGNVVSAYAHMHDKIELLYCMSGEFKAFLNGVEHCFKTGDLLLINSREIHHIVGNSEGDNSYMVLKIEPELLYNSAQAVFEIKYILPFTLSRSTHPKIFYSAELSRNNIPELIAEIKLEFIEKDYGYELAIRSLICRLFLWILRFWKSKGLDLNIHSNISENTVQMLQSVFEYVEEHYSENISVADMAAMCHMSYSYFSRLFKQVMNRSFSEYLTHIRVSEAEKLLTQSDLNIAEIAFNVGFSDAGYFTQKFKGLKGITPKEFKNLYEVG